MFGLFSYRNNKRNQKLNARLALQKTDLKRTISDLKSTQTQLIQSEKMASLGELTAGIAHEIQNPLNFVNNFSDVSGELLDEVDEELVTGNIADAREIIVDLKQNLTKINHHGGRASSIVKGMLAHSRTTSGEKELTDINALCDEYIRLSYHGMRAKDKTFNADFTLDLEEGLTPIRVIPQDLGRVILNILNNAFYAVDKKKKDNEDENFNPKVIIKTALSPSGGSEGEGNTAEGKDHLQITIADNGIGMSPETIDKIFQPFYTTKPTGEGTGLGMSISYDIVTKGHGGELKVESKVGSGTSFTIVLPIDKNLAS